MSMGTQKSLTPQSSLGRGLLTPRLPLQSSRLFATLRSPRLSVLALPSVLSGPCLCALSLAAYGLPDGQHLLAPLRLPAPWEAHEFDSGF